MICYACEKNIKHPIFAGTLQCAMCTQKKLKWLDRLESDSGIRIKNRKDFAGATAFRKEHPEITAQVPFLRPEDGCKPRPHVDAYIPLDRRLKLVKSN